MITLGISAFYHDSAAALLHGGELVAACQEERFTRRKHDSSFPENAVRACLNQAGLSLGDVDCIAFYEQPRLKLNRLLETFMAFAPDGAPAFRQAFASHWTQRRNQEKDIIATLERIEHGFDAGSKLFYAEHHQSHAASAFYPSPFENAAILTLDGVGEWATTSLAVGQGDRLSMRSQIDFPHSIGLLYAAFTYFLGFRVNSGEYKVMGLAPYGEARFAQTILDHLIDLKEDGTFRLNMDYFDYCTGLRMTNQRFADLFQGQRRAPEAQLTQVHMDLAASIQAVTEEVIVRLGRSTRKSTGERNLCMAGGVALNCVANGKLLREGIFDNIWIQPAAGDAGGAIGAAYVATHERSTVPVVKSSGGDKMKGAYLGPSFSDEAIEDALTRCGAVFSRHSSAEIIQKSVEALESGTALGWFHGRMEFGPRALGGRSILADPRSSQMQRTLNLRVKFRESFRPFAPSVLVDDLTDWFELESESPYMLFVAEVAKRRQTPMTDAERALFGIAKLNVARSEIPAVTHVDYSARVQSVDGIHNPQYYSLLAAFKEKTGCPVLVNTSFNVRGEPIVHSPEEAFQCFMGTNIEHMAIGSFFLEKSLQDPDLKVSYVDTFDLD